MKTKIIYISGAEVFDMRDVRAAFEEVRNTLNLGTDTILFGVPVDADDAIATAHNDTVTSTDDAVPVAPMPMPEPEIDVTVTETIDEVTTEEVVAEPIPEPEKPAPKKRGRTKKTATVATEEPATETATVKEDTDTAATDDAPIPILSVLASKSDHAAPIAPEAPIADDADDADDDEDDDEFEEFEDEEEIIEFEEEEFASADEDDEDTEEEVIAEETITVESVSVVDDTEPGDMISEEDPIDTGEKTLEELLDAISPLNEDQDKATNTDAAAVDAMPATSFIDETDATLEQLAAEFAQNEDKIATQNPTGRGKIGKLKNILPFGKKQKRDDNGLMGDLFGWAGIAANDDDFTIPGFFTNAPKN